MSEKLPCGCEKIRLCEEHAIEVMRKACMSACDCDFIGGAVIDHALDCHSRIECDGDHSCDKHMAEAEAEHSWMRGRSKGACTGVMSEQDKQDLRDAGRGHLVRS